MNEKQRRFCREYLVDLNATQAAIRAGYSKRTARSQGHRLLTNADVENEIARLKKERSKRTEITADLVLRELARIGFSDLRDVAEWDSSSLKPKDSSGLSEDASRAIAEVKSTQHGPAIKLHNKTDALAKLGRHLGLFPHQHEHSGPGGQPIQIEARPIKTVEEARKALEDISEAGER